MARARDKQTTIGTRSRCGLRFRPIAAKRRGGRPITRVFRIFETRLTRLDTLDIEVFEAYKL